jgi:hypothetical protein
MFGLGVEGDRTGMDLHALPQNLRRIVFAMNRLGRALFGSTRPCQYGCRYCFAKFDQFASNHLLSVVSNERIREGDILYPACDGEFFSDRRARERIEDLVNSTPNSI